MASALGPSKLLECKIDSFSWAAVNLRSHSSLTREAAERQIRGSDTKRHSFEASEVPQRCTLNFFAVPLTCGMLLAQDLRTTAWLPSLLQLATLPHHGVPRPIDTF